MARDEDIVSVGGLEMSKPFCLHVEAIDGSTTRVTRLPWLRDLQLPCLARQAELSAVLLQHQEHLPSRATRAPISPTMRETRRTSRTAIPPSGVPPSMPWPASAEPFRCDAEPIRAQILRKSRPGQAPVRCHQSLATEFLKYSKNSPSGLTTRLEFSALNAST